MYWPAKVVRHAGDEYEVQYDNGDKEIVLGENVSPFNPPFEFGEESHPLQVVQNTGIYVSTVLGSRHSFCQRDETGQTLRC